MKRWLILLLVLCTLAVPRVLAIGFEMVKVPTGEISTVDTVIDAKLENIGFDRVFVALPVGWQLDEVNSYAKSYAVRESGLWRIYGDPFSSTSLLGSGKVYKEKGIRTKLSDTVGDREGWWLRPNEGVIIHAEIDSISTGGGSIDPQEIEKNNPSIIVKKWVQEFTLTPSSTGFITAPWTVEGAALTIAAPAPVSDATQPLGDLYFEDYEPGETQAHAEVPRWDEWFVLENSISKFMSSKSIVSMEPEVTPTEEINVTTTITPVWRIEDLAPIFYGYEWERDKEIKGITMLGPSFAAVPEWFDWF